jgi:hypothetical protein
MYNGEYRNRAGTAAPPPSARNGELATNVVAISVTVMTHATIVLRSQTCAFTVPLAEMDSKGTRGGMNL